MNTLIIFNDIINIAILESFQKITFYFNFFILELFCLFCIVNLFSHIFFIYMQTYRDTLLSKKYLFWMYNIFNYVKNMNTIY